MGRALDVGGTTSHVKQVYYNVRRFKEGPHRRVFIMAVDGNMFIPEFVS